MKLSFVNIIETLTVLNIHKCDLCTHNIDNWQLQALTVNKLNFLKIICWDREFFCRVRNLKFATYLKFATCQNTNKINEINELW